MPHSNSGNGADGPGKYRAFIGEVGSDLKATLLGGLEFIKWDKYINSHSRVFIKPNFTFPQYKEGVTTNPVVLKALLELLKSKAGSIIVGESDGGNNSFKAEDAFEGHGMYQMCKDMGIELVNLSRLPSEMVESKITGRKVWVQLPEILLENKIDCFISAPVLKVHVMTGVSLSIKNLWGCYPDPMRGLYHKDLDRKLTLITKILNPRIVVMDATYALNKHGPMFGETVKMDLIMAFDNPVVADAMGASIMGIPLKQTRHVLVAEKEGLGTTDIGKIEINQDYRLFKRQFQIEKTFIDRVSLLFFYRPKLAKLVLSSFFTPLIYWIADKCRTREEKELARQIGDCKKISTYY